MARAALKARDSAMCDRCCCVVCISTSEVGVIETCGKYSRLASPGANFVCCCLGDCVSGRLSMRVQQLDVSCETKTLDNVFVTANVSVQYLVVPELAYEAFYRLTSPRAQGRAAPAASPGLNRGEKTQ